MEIETKMKPVMERNKTSILTPSYRAKVRTFPSHLANCDTLRL